MSMARTDSSPERHHRRDDDGGEGAVSYIAGILLMGAIVTMLVTSGIGGQVSTETVAALCRVGQQECTAPGAQSGPNAANPPATSPVPSPTSTYLPAAPNRSTAPALAPASAPARQAPIPAPGRQAPAAPRPLTGLEETRRNAALITNSTRCVISSVRCGSTLAVFETRAATDSRTGAAKNWAEDHDIAISIGESSEGGNYDEELRIYTLNMGDNNFLKFVQKMEELQQKGL